MLADFGLFVDLRLKYKAVVEAFLSSAVWEGCILPLKLQCTPQSSIAVPVGNTALGIGEPDACVIPDCLPPLQQRVMLHANQVPFGSFV